MKNKFAHIIPVAIIMLSIILLQACKKENDLADNFTGIYIDSNTNDTLIVEKVDSKTIKIWGYEFDVDNSDSLIDTIIGGGCMVGHLYFEIYNDTDSLYYERFCAYSYNNQVYSFFAGKK